MPSGSIVIQRRPWSFQGGITLGGSVYEYTKAVTISAAAIIATTAGGFGHANGFELVPTPGASFMLELVSAAVVYQFGVAGYTAGGNTTVNVGSGGAAITGLVAAAGFIGAAANKFLQFIPLSTAANVLVPNTGLNLVSSVAFTNPGTATGVIRALVTYRVHPTGL